MAAPSQAASGGTPDLSESARNTLASTEDNGESVPSTAVGGR